MAVIVIKNHEIVENTLSTSVKLENGRLLVPDNTVLDEPLKITLLNDSNETLEFVVGKNSDLKVILEVLGNDKSDDNYSIKFNVLDNSNVKYLLISALESNKAVINHEFNINKDSNVLILAGLVSNVLTAKLDVNVLGRGATVKIKAIAVSSDSHDQKIDVYMNHKAPYTNGEMTCVGIANKKGRVILNGIEKIDNGMKHSNVYQTLRGIITSDDAIVEVNPILIIDEYDLEGAGHAATVGKLDEDAMYYLQSRGLRKEDAERLIINGFLRPLIDEIDDEVLKDKFVELVNVRI